MEIYYFKLFYYIHIEEIPTNKGANFENREFDHANLLF